MVAIIHALSFGAWVHAHALTYTGVAPSYFTVLATLPALLTGFVATLNQHRTDDTKWLALLILGALTQMAIGIVHLERPRAQLAALMLFTTGLVSTLGLIAVHEWPFDGPAAIKPLALVQAAARIAPGASTAP